MEGKMPQMAGYEHSIVTILGVLPTKPKLGVGKEV